MADDVMPPDLAIARELAARRRRSTASAASAAAPRSPFPVSGLSDLAALLDREASRRRLLESAVKVAAGVGPGCEIMHPDIAVQRELVLRERAGRGGGGAGAVLRPRCRGTASEVGPPVFEPVGEEVPAGGCSDAPSPEVGGSPIWLYVDRKNCGILDLLYHCFVTKVSVFLCLE